MNCVFLSLTIENYFELKKAATWSWVLAIVLFLNNGENFRPQYLRKYSSYKDEWPLVRNVKVCPFQRGVTRLCGLTTFEVMATFIEAYDFKIWQNFFHSFFLVGPFNLSLHLACHIWIERRTSYLLGEKICLQFYGVWAEWLPIKAIS